MSVRDFKKVTQYNFIADHCRSSLIYIHVSTMGTLTKLRVKENSIEQNLKAIR